MASEDALVETALGRLDDLIAEGVTTIEVKSGYGLSLEAELKMLRAARRLADERSICVRTSLLGAHALSPRIFGAVDAYVTEICESMIPEAARLSLADAVDGFCEKIGFSAEQIERVFAAATACGLPVKLHAEQPFQQPGC